MIMQGLEPEWEDCDNYIGVQAINRQAWKAN